MKKICQGLSLIVLGLFISGCGIQNLEVYQASQTPLVITKVVTVVVEVTSTPVQQAPVQTSQIPTREEAQPWVLATDAADHVGENVQVKVELAHCTYQADVSGTPTFCNDQPFPNHKFTFLIWGQDWSYLDQSCVIVEGVVEMYQGKPQIEVTSTDDLSSCDGY
jgi:hypothetical protein